MIEEQKGCEVYTYVTNEVIIWRNILKKKMKLNNTYLMKIQRVFFTKIKECKV
jgi:hypothetical protein